jgi:hypothetical protein
MRHGNTERHDRCASLGTVRHNFGQTYIVTSFAKPPVIDLVGNSHYCKDSHDLRELPRSAIVVGSSEHPP